MKDGPSMVIDAIALFQLAADPAFFAALPPGLDDWASRCRAAYDQVVNQTIRSRSRCAGCSHVGKVMSDVLSDLGRRLAAFRQAGGSLDSLADLIATKRDYRPRPIVLYYRSESGKILVLSF